MKKEINGWVYKDQRDDYRGAVFHITLPDNLEDIGYRAKLVIEIPEKKIIITESEFMNCVVKYCHSHPEVKTLNEMMERFKVELFGD